MDARYVQRGDAIDHTPAADVAAGDVVVIGKIVGVAKLDIKAGELGALTAFAAGAEVGWDAASKKAVAAGASGSAKFGHAVADADAADGAVFVRLQQGLN